MKTLDEIKDNVAQEVGYTKWDELAWDYALDGAEMERQMEAVAKRYAESAIEQCAEDAEGFVNFDCCEIDHESILNVKTLLK